LMIGVLSAMRNQDSAIQVPLLHHDKEDWNEDEDVDSGRNHAADDGRGNRFHHVGADAGFPLAM
ncbi:MAG: hypothetical protein WBD10_05780, partial [Acidobacteriaceae bacterium]